MAKSSDSPTNKTPLRTKILLVLGGMAMIATFHAGFIFFVVAIMPAIVACYLDRSRSHSSYHTILACNLSGVLPFMFDILEQGRSNSVITEMMGDISTWAVVYGAAGFGCLLTYATPVLGQALINGFHQAQIMRYEGLQKRLIEDWGPEVSNIFAADQKDNAA